MESNRQDKRVRDLIWNYWGVVVLILFLAVTFGYILVKRDGIYLQVHDFLDDRFIWLSMMKKNRLFFENGKKAPFLGGIGRNYLYSDLKAYALLYYFLPEFWAVIAAWYLRIFLSVTGFLAVKKTAFLRETDANIFVVCGLVYGILPVFPPANIGFAVLPGLYALLCRMYEKFSWKHLLLLFLYPAFSDFSFFGIFLCGYIVVFFLLQLIVKRKALWRFAAAAVSLGIGYIVTEWRLFAVMFFSGEETIRNVFQPDYYSLSEAIKAMSAVFVRGRYHSQAQHTWVVLPVCLVYFVFLNVKYIKQKKIKEIFADKYNLLFLCLIFHAVMYGIDYMKWFDDLIGAIIPPLKEMQFSRLLWFNAYLWYLAFAVVLTRIAAKKKTKAFLCILALVAACFSPAIYNHICYNSIIAGQEILGKTYFDALSYREFFSEDLFEEIKEQIGYEGEWAAAYGFHPAVLEYSGIATLDGYLSYYPLKYKETFRALIAPELKDDEEAKASFDGWGARAYLFSTEVSYAPERKMSVTEADLKIDPAVFKALGGRYLFSRVMIRNAEELGLSSEGIYGGENSPYTIYVYVLEEGSASDGNHEAE